MTNSVQNHRPIIYVAGAYRGPHAYAIELNVRLAEDAGLRLAEIGAVPLIPHTMYRFFQGALPDTFWLPATLDLLRRSDAVLLLRNFRESIGALAERTEAERCSLPIFQQDIDDAVLHAWVKRAIREREE